MNTPPTTTEPTRPARLALLARGVMWFYFSLALGYAALWVMTMVQGLAWRADFSAFYTAWTMVLDGQGANLYDLELQARYQQAILGGRSFEGGLLRFNNPPHVAVLLAPLGLLPRETAFLLWTVAQVGMLFWLLRLLSQIAHDWHPRERWLLYSAVVAFPPILNSFFLGTFSLWVTLCLAQFYLLLKQRHDTQAGFWLSLGTFKPQMVLLPGVMLPVARRWHALGTAAAVGGALFVLCSLVLGWHIWLDFLGVLRGTAELFDAAGVDPTIMYNLKGTLTLLLGSEHAALLNQVSLAALGIVLLLVVWLWRGPWQPDAPAFAPRFALTVLLGLLFSPHLNPHDSFALLIPAALCYGYLRQHRPAQQRAYALFALSCPLLFLLGEFTIGGSLGVRVPVLLMLVLTCWLIVVLATPAPAQASVPAEG
jgi:hypothetical protein